MSLCSVRLCAMIVLLVLTPGCSEEPPPALPPLRNLVPPQALEPVQEQIREAWEAANAAPDEAAAAGGLGMVLSAYARSEPARNCYRRARRLDPEGFRWPYYEAISLGDLGRPAEAIAAMDGALALRPDHTGARLRQAGWLADTGEPERSAELYEAVLSVYPERADARLGLARLLLEQGDAQTAAALLRAALETDWRIGEIHYVLSRTLLRLGDQTGAEQHAALFRRFEGRQLHVPDPEVQAVTELNLSDKPHLTRAAWFREQGHLEEAAAALEQALAVNPHNPPARLHLIEVYAQSGRMAAARGQYLAAVTESPGDPQPHAGWARLQRSALDYAGAARSFTRALTLEPDRPEVLAELGFVLEQQGRRDSAAERYRQALALAPGHLGAHAGLGRMLLAGGDAAGSIPHLEQAARMPAAERPRLLYRLAEAYRSAGRSGAARKALEEARPLAAADADVRLAADIDAALETLAQTPQKPQ